MRIATMMSIAILGISGAALAQTTAPQSQTQTTSNTTAMAPDNGTTSDDSMSNSATMPDNGMTSNTTDDATTSAPGNATDSN